MFFMCMLYDAPYIHSSIIENMETIKLSVLCSTIDDLDKALTTVQCFQDQYRVKSFSADPDREH